MKKWIFVLCLAFLLTGCSTNQQMDVSTTLPGTSATTTTQAPTPSDPTSGTQATEPSDPAESTEPTAPIEPQPITFTVYAPNEAWDGYEQTAATISELDPLLVLQALQNANVVTKEATVLSATVDGNNMLTLDMNEAFLMQIYSMGSIGEGMLMGSMVNTFLSAYGCDSMMILAEGQIIHSGHVDYDFPMTPSN